MFVWRTREEQRDSLTVRFLVSGSGTWTAELLGLLSSRIGDEEGSIVRDEEILKAKNGYQRLTRIDEVVSC